jgi:hypothetical protein
VVKKVLELLKLRLVYWADYPYILNNSKPRGYKKFEYKPDWPVKEKLMEKYSSQYYPIFGRKELKKIPEYYFLKNKI